MGPHTSLCMSSNNSVVLSPIPLNGELVSFHECKAHKLHMTHSRMDLDIHHLATFESFFHGCDLAYNATGMHCSSHLVSFWTLTFMICGVVSCINKPLCNIPLVNLPLALLEFTINCRCDKQYWYPIPMHYHKNLTIGD